ncbi:twin-arginine translocation signal domain-containing protein [Natronococcus sp. A-GB1]|uniref:twin-arginine translocation signal domain-containing protein n=1 Tax=Natronococcus sp. A-GB1 TaxID=3037648 RepID=UPI00241E406D|nr:twin-arginine translocation signal domain-containing protein [Natronococcus sp. A-GB1]MDG5759836.1 twin-arginine translocation signal domain-containing protein [Natronococcus sp. A-GB1]
MTDHTRRTVLKAVGASTLAIALAGCAGDDDNGDDDDEENGNGADGEFEIEAGTEIVLDGYSSHWEGLEPSEIEEEENPTLVLEEGEEYTIEWINADGITHDLQIWDEDDELVDDLATDSVEEEGEGDSLEFTAEPEMVTYVCEYHEANQIGDLVVE